MVKKQAKQKLSLSQERIRELSDQALRNVAGGSPTTTTTQYPTNHSCNC